LIKKSLVKPLLIISWKYLKVLFYRKNFFNWGTVYLDWLFLKTTLELKFSLEYFVSLTLSYLGEEEIERIAWENEEGSSLILPYTLETPTAPISCLVYMFNIGFKESSHVCFSLAQRMFFKIALLYQYFGYLTRKIIQTKENNIFQVTLNLNQYSLKYAYRTLETLKPKVTLFFYNLKKAFFKKFLSLRHVLWVISTKGNRTKRRYKNFSNFRLKNQSTIGSYQLVFYILRQLDILYSWEHLTILLHYSLVKVNRDSNHPSITLQQGDTIECYFGMLLGEYQDTIIYLIEKYRGCLQRKLYQDNFSNRKFFNKHAKIPYFIKLLPYMQRGATIGYTLDYTLNTILITYIPSSINLLPISYYYNLSLLYLSIWRYNV